MGANRTTKIAAGESEALPADCERVRWKSRGRWRYGLADDTTTSPAGNLIVRDQHNGGVRTLPARSLEREIRGPRGGRHWEPCHPTETPDPAARPSWRQLTLFEDES